MTHDQSISPSTLTSNGRSTISESVSVKSEKALSTNLYNISYLLKRIRGERSSKTKSWSSEISIRQQPIFQNRKIYEQKSLLNNIMALTNIQQQTFMDKPIYRHKTISQFHKNRLKFEKNPFVINHYDKQSHTKRHKSYKRSLR